MNVHTINPATEDIISEYSIVNPQNIEDALSRAHQSYLSFKKETIEHRGMRITSLAKVLRANKEALAQKMTQEMGKLLSESIAEVSKCADLCDFLIEKGPGFLRDVSVADKPKAIVTFQPTGVIFCIMPWNFPVWQVMRFALPSLLVGNTVILKHAPNVWGVAQMIQDYFEQAGFKNFEFQNLRVDVDQVERIISDRRITGVSITGSTRAGRSVGGLAGKHLKKSVLELGGSDAILILKDADLDLAVKKLVSGRMLNAGQSCVSPKRWIIDQSVHDEFTQKVLTVFKSLKFGSPLDSSSSIGPIARKDLRDQLHEQVKRSKQGGAQVLIGGEIPQQKGFYYPPTILDNVGLENTAAKEELFGPVAIVIKAKDEKDAIRIANQSDYGLGASVFSRDVERAARILKEEIDAGICFVNDFVRSDARWPFGGVKDSGYGRELSQFGLIEFANIKSVVI